MLLAFASFSERELARVPGMSVAIMSAAQGRYSSSQLLLDISQGARIADSAYPSPVPVLALARHGPRFSILGWQSARARAAAAPQLLSPGLLAAQIPRGAGYAGLTGMSAPDAAAAADLDGRLAAVSLGTAATLPARTQALLARQQLVVADLPPGAQGLGALRALSAQRAQGELLLVLQRPARASEGELLWLGAAGLPGGAGKELSSASTTQRGLALDIDITATVLAHLQLRPPSQLRGSTLRSDGALDSRALVALMARLRVISPRRLPALAWLLIAWAALALACSRSASARAWALRTGALGVLWAPVAVLVPAALEPSAPVEYALLAALCLALGALTDALLAWPRALLAPALGVPAALSADALAHTQLLLRSLLGPDPILGARFYGIGNELKSGLAVLVLAGAAGSLYPSVRSRRSALTVAFAGVPLALIEGSARIGAGVGGVILVSFAFACAAASLLGGAITRTRALAILLAPPLALLALAGIDLATAHGTGHFTGSVLHARSLTDVRDIVVRRYEAAWRELRSHAMPLATAVSVLCAACALAMRRRLLAPVADDPAWQAALIGALAAGLMGALVEDSGPLLLVVAVFCGGCVCCYLWGRPRELTRSSASRDTVFTRSVQHDLVLGDRERHALAETRDRPLERRVGEGHHRAALIAHEMVVVPLRSVRALVAHHRLARLHALHQAQLLELVEDPVDARPAHRPRVRVAQRLLDLGRRQRAAL